MGDLSWWVIENECIRMRAAAQSPDGRIPDMNEETQAVRQDRCMVTSTDVARLAGVSQPTVSRVLSGSTRISGATRMRVLEAMDALGYVPHAGAQAMRTSLTHTLGVVVDDVTNPFYAEVIDELTRELDAAGNRVVLWNSGAESHRDALHAIRERSVDGVIFTTATEGSAELAAAVEAESPIVLINRVVEGLDCDQVASDNRSGGRLVADYFLENGFQRAAILMGMADASTSKERAEAFLSRMAEAGYPVPAGRRLRGDFSYDASLRLSRDMMDATDHPDAIFCVSDLMAFGALDALRSLTLRAGEGCWVVGYDDVEMSSWPSFDLTTIKQPSREMARVGARMLMERIKNPELLTRRVEFRCELVIRGSTGHAAYNPSR